MACHSNHHFIVRRQDKKPCQIPMSYLGTSDPQDTAAFILGLSRALKESFNQAMGKTLVCSIL